MSFVFFIKINDITALGTLKFYHLPKVKKNLMGDKNEKNESGEGTKWIRQKMPLLIFTYSSPI